ncbi:TPA: hypothetical protein HA244_03845 [Candidatus Micrarchaeota archaeon]|nr:hypothetical protein [Candidatus Micrarchaeota archaeon]
MAKLVFKHKGVEYHFQLGEHRTVPSPEERIVPSDLDAIVFENGVQNSVQGRAALLEAFRAGKPVYLVENEKLHAEHSRRLYSFDQRSSEAERRAFLGYLLSSVGKVAIATNATVLLANMLSRSLTNPRPLTRRQFLARMGIFGLTTGASLVPLFSGRRMTGQSLLELEEVDRDVTAFRKSEGASKTAAEKISTSLGVTKAELDALPNDNPQGLIAKRNAVIAEGIARLVRKKKFRKVGVIGGTFHYNIPDYIFDRALRKKTRGEFEPEIVEVRPNGLGFENFPEEKDE